jgi:DNA-binding transcriptional ArsR family regulator
MVRPAHQARNCRTRIVDDRDPRHAPSDLFSGVAGMAGHAKEAAEFLKGLAHEDRLLILCALSQGEKSVSELERLLDFPQATASQHLARLRQGGLVARRTEGAAVFYRVKNPETQTILQAVFQAFCAEHGNLPMKK